MRGRGSSMRSLGRFEHHLAAFVTGHGHLAILAKDRAGHASEGFEKCTLGIEIGAGHFGGGNRAGFEPRIGQSVGKGELVAGCLF